MWKFVLPVAGVATSFAGPKQHLDFEAMTENFRSISQKQMQGETIPQSTFDSVKNFVGQISALVKGALDTDKGYAQSIYDKSKADVEACDTARQTTKDGAVNTATGAADGADTAWDTCKGEEQTEFTNMTTHCDDCDDYVNNWNGDHCAGVDFTNGDSDAVETYMTCICKFVADHKDTYYEKRQNCTDATTKHSDKKTECGNPGKQADMDDAYCAEQKAIQLMCSDYKTCRDREEGELAGIKTTVEGWEDVMQSQRVALEQLICFGEHILDNKTDLSGCDDAHAACSNYTDCPTINYPAATDRVKCSEPDAKRLPCQAVYKTDVYSQYDNGDVPPDTCKDTCTVVHPFENFEAAGAGGGGGGGGAAGSGGAALTMDTGMNWCSQAEGDHTNMGALADCPGACKTGGYSFWGTAQIGAVGTFCNCWKTCTQQFNPSFPDGRTVGNV